MPQHRPPNENAEATIDPLALFYYIQSVYDQKCFLSSLLRFCQTFYLSIKFFRIMADHKLDRGPGIIAQIDESKLGK